VLVAGSIPAGGVGKRGFRRICEDLFFDSYQIAKPDLIYTELTESIQNHGIWNVGSMIFLECKQKVDRK
jgi:hypothetical protein